MKTSFIKRLVSSATSLVMITSCFAGVITANAANKEFELGNMSCVLSDDGTLTVSGTGAMSTVAAPSRPWKQGTCQVEEIKKIVVSDGITEVRNFSNLTSLVSVELAKSVTSIQAQAFNGCTDANLVIDIKGKITYVNPTMPFGSVKGTIYVYDTSSLELVKENASTANVVLNVDISGLKNTLQELVEQTRSDHPQDNYTEDSYKALNEALKAAEAVVAEDNPSQEKIQNATNAINDAVKNLVTVINGLKDELKALITEAKNKISTTQLRNQYTISSAAALDTAISDAEKTLNKQEVTKEELIQAKTALETASKDDETGLAETGLKKQASNAARDRRVEALNNLEQSEKYTPESYAKYKEAYDKLSAFQSKLDDVTDQQIDAAIADLNAAKEQLVPVEIVLDTKAYEAAKKAVEDILNAENSSYTKNSLEALKSIYDHQKSIIEDESGKIKDDMLQSRINSIVEILKRSIDPTYSDCVLVEKGDLTNLKDLVESTKDLAEANYTAETWKALSEELTTANALINDPDNAAKADVDASEKTLKNAIDELVYKSADYTAVDKAIEKAPSDLSIYTDQTAKALKDAINAVDRNKNITEQADVDAFAKAIEDAIKALVKKSASSSKKPGTVSGTSGKSSVKSAAQLKAEKAMNQAKVKKLTVKSKAKKTIVVKWNKVKNAKGYQVQVSTKKTFKKLIINKKSVKKNKITIKNKKLKKGKKYFIRVRAYATYKNSKGITKKAYSSWNKKLRTVKIK